MRSISYRTFLIDNKKYSFSLKGFNNAINNYKDKTKTIKLNDIFQDIADNLHISVEAIKKWRAGYNGPSNIEMIKNIASFLECDYKDLLVEQITEDIQINNSDIQIDMNVEGEEKDILKSLLSDLLSIIEDYVKNDFPVIRYLDNDLQDHYLNWFDDIGLKLRKNSFGIKKDNYKKFEKLYFETRFSIDNAFSKKIPRWCEIQPIFNLFYEYDIEELHDMSKDGLDWDLFVYSDQYLDDNMKDYLKSELDAYCNDHISWDQPLWVLGIKFGTWYLDLIRHDFPELFLD